MLLALTIAINVPEFASVQRCIINTTTLPDNPVLVLRVKPPRMVNGDLVTWRSELIEVNDVLIARPSLAINAPDSARPIINTTMLTDNPFPEVKTNVKPPHTEA